MTLSVYREGFYYSWVVDSDSEYLWERRGIALTLRGAKRAARRAVRPPSRRLVCQMALGEDTQ